MFILTILFFFDFELILHFDVVRMSFFFYPQSTFSSFSKHIHSIVGFIVDRACGTPIHSPECVELPRINK